NSNPRTHINQTLRLPLRHEVGDLSCLGSNERNPRSGGPRGPSERERVSHWAGERWCSGLKGKMNLSKIQTRWNCRSNTKPKPPRPRPPTLDPALSPRPPHPQILSSKLQTQNPNPCPLTPSLRTSANPCQPP